MRGPLSSLGFGDQVALQGSFSPPHSQAAENSLHPGPACVGAMMVQAGSCWGGGGKGKCS